MMKPDSVWTPSRMPCRRPSRRTASCSRRRRGTPGGGARNAPRSRTVPDDRRTSARPACAYRQTSSIVVLAEGRDQIGAVLPSARSCPNAVEHRVRQPLGDFDLADGRQGLHSGSRTSAIFDACTRRRRARWRRPASTLPNGRAAANPTVWMFSDWMPSANCSSRTTPTVSPIVVPIVVGSGPQSTRSGTALRRTRARA